MPVAHLGASARAAVPRHNGDSANGLRGGPQMRVPSWVTRRRNASMNFAVSGPG